MPPSRRTPTPAPTLATVLAPLRAAARTPAALAELAAALEAEAAALRARADALTRQQQRPSAQRATPRRRQAGPGRTPSTFVRLERTTVARSSEVQVRLHIGRGIYYDLRKALHQDGPLRLDVVWVGTTIRLVVVEPPHGFAVTVSHSAMPRIRCDSARDLLAALPDGRYAATVVSTAIVLGAWLPQKS